MNIDEVRYRMKHQLLYDCNDDVLVKEQLAYLDQVFAYNQLKPSEQAEKQALLKKMFAAIGEDCYFETPMHASWGGKHVHIGNNFYANFNLTLIDDGDIYIGNDVLIACNVVLCSGTHPIDPRTRSKKAQYNVPVHIHDNVWIGANCVVLPGVTIGKNSVIGAGSVVNKDIPSNVVAVGNPCRVLRSISEDDRKTYHHDKQIDL